MRILPSAVLVLVALAALLETDFVVAKKPSRPRSSAASSRRVSTTTSSSSSSSRSSGGRAPVSRRRQYEEEEEFEDEEDQMDFPPDVEEEEEEFFDEEEEEEILQPKSGRGSSARRAPPSSRTARDAAIRRSSPRKRPPPSRSRYEDDDDYMEDYGRPRSRSTTKRSSGRRGPPPRGSRAGRRPPPGRVVPYTRQQPGAFTRGLAAIRGSLPDPSSVRDAAVSSFNAARETSSNLSANLYREVKGLTSSELEQVMLKATRPDDTAVKGKHVERLVGVTYQISARYDIYDSVLRKLWAKMTEKDWRTKIKALYILHRFSADGSPDHAPALKARLRELRRTRDPKRKDKYFNSKQLLAGDSRPETAKYRAFTSRYAHYVLLRTQCFGGMFDEISQQPKADKKKPPKPITSTALRTEHLDAAAMLLKAGVACQLKEGEECENTAIAAERVASDLIGLTTAVAIAMNRALKDDDLKGADPVLLRKWCEFYSEELLPQTKAMVKKTSTKLDAYGLFLPSRMGTSVPQDLLEKGLHLEERAVAVGGDEGASEDETQPSETTKEEAKSSQPEKERDEEVVEEEEDEAEYSEEEALDEEAELDDEYEYEEEEYYDDEED